MIFPSLLRGGTSLAQDVAVLLEAQNNPWASRRALYNNGRILSGGRIILSNDESQGIITRATIFGIGTDLLRAIIPPGLISDEQVDGIVASVQLAERTPLLDFESIHNGGANSKFAADLQIRGVIREWARPVHIARVLEGVNISTITDDVGSFTWEEAEWDNGPSFIRGGGENDAQNSVPENNLAGSDGPTSASPGVVCNKDLTAVTPWGTNVGVHVSVNNINVSPPPSDDDEDMTVEGDDGEGDMKLKQKGSEKRRRSKIVTHKNRLMENRLKKRAMIKEEQKNTKKKKGRPRKLKENVVTDGLPQTSDTDKQTPSHPPNTNINMSSSVSELEQPVSNSVINNLINQLESKLADLPSNEKLPYHNRLLSMVSSKQSSTEGGSPLVPRNMDDQLVCAIKSPVAKAATVLFKRKMEETDTPTRQDMLSSVKLSFKKKQKVQLQPSKKVSPDDPIDNKAFRSLTRLDESSSRVQRLAAEKNRKTILGAGDDDQITLALRDALAHPDIRPYYERIVGEQNIEAARVGLHAVQGMKALVDMVAQNKGSGGRSKQCRSLLQAIVMCLMGNIEDPVAKEAIRRQILPGLSKGASIRLMKKAGEKRKRLEDEELSQFKIVEEEEDRSKYKDGEIEALIS